MKSKKSKLFLLILLLFVLIIFSVSRRKKRSKVVEDVSQVSETFNLEESNKESDLGPLSIKMISPVEEEFIPGQARFWKGELSNAPKGKFIVCDWKFYLSMFGEEEVLYQEQSTRGSSEWCGFTSTFIEDEGKLRVELEVNIKDRYDSEEIIGTASTEETFLVKKNIGL